METLPIPPEVEITKEYIDPVVSVTFENGIEQVRQRWSRPKILFRVSFSDLQEAEKELLESFYARHRCFSPFLFPYESKTYTVRFNKPIQVKQTAPNLYTLSAELIEAWGAEL
ncbi:hypothetical protein GFV12_05365 [Desulfurobacterium thermolithotrophum]|uniref:phage tail protein n=1 Tax=Desulfurobacterium thermolithotrophum TaxID=64160 RepID=UPI0013D77819|nr:phage tail protein [Desulfurobacterium thermolithotrophum]